VRLEAQIDEQIDELAASVESCHSPRAAHPQSSAAAEARPSNDSTDLA